MKQVIFWDAKRVPLRDKAGNPIEGEFTGAFGTKVHEGAPGAYHYKGANPAAGIEWDFWQREVTAVSGRLRWIDKQGSDYGTNLVFYLESDKAVHRISIDYDAINLRQVVNHLCGLKESISTAYINVNYWVRKAKDKDGQVKTTKNGNTRWDASLMFPDIAPAIPFDQYKQFAIDNELEWRQVKNAKGETSWDQSGEFRYWDSRLVGIQKFLLKTPDVLPFTYNSLTACEADNPSGGGNLSKEERELCAEIYQRIRANYKMPFHREQVDADSVADDYSAPSRTVQATPANDLFPKPDMTPDYAADSVPPHVWVNPPLPTVDVTSHDETGDDLPF